jgi:PadR family transcriptional regulator AphA
VHRITPAGRRLQGAWLERPVHHLRDMRLEFRLKLVLLDRLEASPRSLIRAQRDALAPAFSTLRRPARSRTVDHVELWRRHSTAAIAAYLDELERRTRR